MGWAVAGLIVLIAQRHRILGIEIIHGVYFDRPAYSWNLFVTFFLFVLPSLSGAWNTEAQFVPSVGHASG